MVVACAMMLPPMGLVCGPANMAPAPSGLATTWRGERVWGGGLI